MDDRTFFHVTFVGCGSVESGWSTLGTIRGICIDKRCSAQLYDNQGFRKGTVYPDGSVTQ